MWEVDFYAKIQILEIHIYCVYSPQRSDDILCGDNHIVLVCFNNISLLQ